MSELIYVYLDSLIALRNIFPQRRRKLTAFFLPNKITHWKNLIIHLWLFTNTNVTWTYCYFWKPYRKAKMYILYGWFPGACWHFTPCVNEALTGILHFFYINIFTHHLKHLCYLLLDFYLNRITTPPALPIHFVWV